jgi:hypothetical protein
MKMLILRAIEMSLENIPKTEDAFYSSLLPLPG